MGKGRTLLALLLLAGILAVIILTWGSIGSAAMILGLLLAAEGLHSSLKAMKRMAKKEKEEKPPVSFNEHE